ncbi:serine hydrolase domain-containing protein [Qipengyuania sp. DGS5-3]|uniref:serine hydrolase domain-containing protein n=1 Tax=Qipengyuania sp. DGS5-3 TaxID=3349632 RepID=UPI0036D2E7D5
MIRSSLGALALLAVTTSASAQSAQEQLDTRYDRALAAGYKALFLCSALGNAERNGTTRTPESVHDWELTGIQAPLDDIIRDLPYTVVRGEDGVIDHVEVTWDEAMPPRFAALYGDGGCSILPISATEYWANPARAGFDFTMPSSDERTTGEEQQPVRTRYRVSEVAKSAFKERYGEGTRSTAVIVTKNGDLHWDEYADGFDPKTPQRTWSVAKSIAATLVGAAVHRGEVDVSESAGLGIHIYDPRFNITVDHALRMASGRYSDTAGNRTDPLYWGGTTVTERAENWPLLHTPGTVYRYANNDTLAAVQAIEHTFEENPPAKLFAELGMYNTVAEADWEGNYVLSSQVWSTAQDLAKLGQLYLDDGVLPNGTRILPENWREYVSSPSGPQPAGRPFGYGAGFWLLNNSEGVPADTFAAFGNRGQYVVIVPSRNVVIVRRGEDPVGSRFDIATFTRDVLAALGN